MRDNIPIISVKSEVFLKNFLKYHKDLIIHYTNFNQYIRKDIGYSELAGLSKKCSEISKFIKRNEFLLKPDREFYESNIDFLLSAVNTEYMILARGKYSELLSLYVNSYKQYKILRDKIYGFNNGRMPDRMEKVLNHVVDTIIKRIDYNIEYILTVIGHLQILSNNENMSIKDIVKIFK